MASLKNGETSVDVTRNENRMGDSGRRKRQEDSCYLLAGGSRDIYSVTINFYSGHFCKVDGGANCKGNMHGKGQKFGPINARDTHKAQEWCKHVQAVLANVEQIAEAQEISAQAFGKKAQAVECPAPSDIESAPETVAESADPRNRLAKLEAERAELLTRSAADDKAGELRDTVAELVKAHGWDSVRDAVNSLIA
ncbi:hypothetical protein LCGC14_0817420 [marine sediment metagenome]|uniref:Uncharacterized protein n=1 Tax=marine sediment metagenome TaxID=412755 RepID=A0A0F9Q582_9ZZZZ